MLTGYEDWLPMPKTTDPTLNELYEQVPEGCILKEVASFGRTMDGGVIEMVWEDLLHRVGGDRHELMKLAAYARWGVDNARNCWVLAVLERIPQPPEERVEADNVVYLSDYR